MAWLWLVTAMLQLRTMKWLNYWWWRDSKLRLSRCWSGAGAATKSRPTLVVASSAMTAIMETTSTGRKTKTINPNMLIGMAISLFNAYVDILYLWTSLEVPRNPAFKYVQSRLIWRHIGPNQYGAVGIGKIQIIKWQCSSENYLHSN